MHNAFLEHQGELVARCGQFAHMGRGH
jgi:hypothetical protein